MLMPIGLNGYKRDKRNVIGRSSRHRLLAARLDEALRMNENLRTENELLRNRLARWNDAFERMGQLYKESR